MSGSKWKGEEAFESALAGLSGQSGASALNVAGPAITFAVDIAFQYIDYYKFVVHDLEKWMKRQSSPNDRIVGIVLLDAICRESRRLNGNHRSIFLNMYIL
jgi:hypothetical protein